MVAEMNTAATHGKAHRECRQDPSLSMVDGESERRHPVLATARGFKTTDVVPVDAPGERERGGPVLQWATTSARMILAFSASAAIPQLTAEYGL